MAELARWQAEVDRDNPAMLDVEQAFLETLEREMPQTSPGKLDAICQCATARAAELNAGYSETAHGTREQEPEHE